jgi:type IX secretion system PorP/SprF family membrane protein
MRLFLLYITLFFSVTWLHGQKLPVFQQKLTDDFLFNPALTGVSGGSISFNYKKPFSSISGAPETFYATAHTVLSENPLGIGLSFYSEQLDLLTNSRGSVSSSYQISLNKSYTVSFGLGYEFFQQSSLNTRNIFVRDYDDPLLNVDNQIRTDVSAGALLIHDYFDLGIAYGRLSSGLSSDTNNLLNGYYAIHASGHIKTRFGYDLLEPTILYLSNMSSDNIVNASLFYTYNNRLIGGITYRSEAIGILSFGVRFENRYLFTYSFQEQLSNEGRDLGHGHELTIRIDLNSQYFKRVDQSSKSLLKSSTFKKKTQ